MIYRLMADSAADTGAARHPGTAGCVPLTPTHPEPAGLHVANAVLTEQIRLFEGALGNMSQGICMFDADSRLVVSNPRYHEIFKLGLPRF